MLPPALAGLVAAAFATSAPASAQQPLGAKPAYTGRALSEVPGRAAMQGLIWAPGLDDGYLPQGVTYIDGDLYVATYRSEDTKQDRGPCRLYRVNPMSGAVTGALDLPPQCGHAGGTAPGRKGHLWVADTRIIFEISLRSNAAEIGRVTRSIKLTGDLRGSAAGSTADALWLATYAKEPGAKLYKLPFATLDSGAESLSEHDAAAALPLPIKVQGVAFGKGGRLWVTRSGSTFGELAQLDLATGAVLQRFDMPAGIEDISFAPDGHLWAVSEAGSKRWLAWKTFFPVIFRLPPS